MTITRPVVVDGLAGHPAIGVLGQDGVQHRVGDLVADLVGVPFGDGFRGENTVCHWFLLS